MPIRPLVATLACLLAAGPALPAPAPSSPPPAAVDGKDGQATGQAAAEHHHHGGLPDDVPGLQKAAIEAYEADDPLRFVQATIKLRNARPYEPQYMIGMVVGAALLGRQTTAYSYMHKMQQQGLSFDFNSTEDTRSIRGTEVYDYINDLLIRAGEPLGEAEVAFTLPESPAYPEAIAWDPDRERFLIGKPDTGEVLAVARDGATETLLAPGAAVPLWAIHGLAVDAARQRLWVATAAVPSFEGLARSDLGKSALLGFDLNDLELEERYDVPADGVPHVLGSLAVLPDGDVYAIDRAVPVLYRKTSAGDALEPYLGNRELVGFRDLVASADGQRLYVADAALGILVVDPLRDASAMLTGPDTLNLGGISGLMVDDNALLMVQNGIRPQRVLRLELDDAGGAVANVQPVANAMDVFESPSFGIVHDGAAWYFAGSNGPGAHAGPVEPRVLKSPVKLEKNYQTPEQRKFREESLNRQKSATPDG